MICGNTSDFIIHPLKKDSVGLPTTPGPQAPHHLNPALCQQRVFLVFWDLIPIYLSRDAGAGVHDGGTALLPFEMGA